MRLHTQNRTIQPVNYPGQLDPGEENQALERREKFAQFISRYRKGNPIPPSIAQSFSANSAARVFQYSAAVTMREQKPGV